MNAYELADELQDLHGLYCEDAANMLRQQADRIAELEKQTKPLSDDEIEQLREYHGINDWLYETSVIDFARAIEERHGIK